MLSIHHVAFMSQIYRYSNTTQKKQLRQGNPSIRILYVHSKYIVTLQTKKQLALLQPSTFHSLATIKARICVNAVNLHRGKNASMPTK